MKTAIIYYSMSGNTKYVADKIADGIKTSGEVDIIRIEPKKAYPDKGAKKFLWGGKSAVMGETPALQPYKFNIEKYDQIIFGTPVWASNFTPPLRTFFENNDLTGKKIAVIATSAGGDSAKCVEAVKTAAKADSLAAVLSLVDPKEKPSDENEKQISAFIDTCKGL